jgi:hypothetical protein
MIFFIKIFISKIIPNLKVLLLLFLIFIIELLLYYYEDSIKNLNVNYFEVQNDINFHFNSNINSKINIAFHCYSIKNGGRARLTSLILNHLFKIKIFRLYLFTQKYKEKNEYVIPYNIKRLLINKNSNLIKATKKKKINILIYQLSDVNDIKVLNKNKNLKVIYYLHSCFFYWLYAKDFKSLIYIYKELKESKYVITLVPFENYYLFKKWGINSILMSNFLTFNIDSVIPSNLSTNTILMIGRGNDKLKRFILGIIAMKFIIDEVSDSEMKIISNAQYIGNLRDIVETFNLQNNVKFVGYTSEPEIYFKNSSIHIFPTVSESFGYVLCETKIYGIPNILLGLDYVSIAKGGTIIIYDDSPNTIGIEAIKILKKNEYKKELGREARKSMKPFNNQLLSLRWIKIILSIFNGNIHYQKINKFYKTLSISENMNLFKIQVNFLKKRNPNFKNISYETIANFSALEQYL